MGEARRKMQKLRESLLWQAESWCFSPSDWETSLVDEILDIPIVHVPRMLRNQIDWMGMPSQRCHENAFWYEKNDPTNQTKAVTGWWFQGMEFILHSVVGCDRQYRCITPTDGNDDVIHFRPDPKIEWVSKDGHLAALRNGQEIGIGVRPFPKFTIAQNTLMLRRLLSGTKPRNASEFTSDEMKNLLDENLSYEERNLIFSLTTGISVPVY